MRSQPQSSTVEKTSDESLSATEEQTQYRVPADLSTYHCSAGFVTNMGSCAPCPKGHFSLPGWVSCLPYLTCDDISHDVRIEGHLTSGGVKHVFYGEWNGVRVVYNQGHLQQDFQHGLEMLQALAPHPRLVLPLGFCGDVLITLRYKLGSAERVDEVLASEEYKQFDNCATRFRMAYDYVTILAYLHSSPIGVRVMCDSADLKKTLSQYLITDGLRLILNDVDALPEVNHGEGRLIRCGHRELFGEFLAPEQKWPFPGEPFTDDKMPMYDEKVDIWRIPPVVEFLMGQTAGSCPALTQLVEIHTKCRNIDARQRPSAQEVFEWYEMVWESLSLMIQPDD